MRRGLAVNIFFLIVILLTVGCNKVPDYVIPPDDMSEILADIYVAEAVVDNNHREFNNDSSKMLLKQSILRKRGYNLAQLDTSFMWYGKNIDKYNMVNDATVEILKKRIEEQGRRNLVAGGIEGDSLQLWDKSNFLILNRNVPSQFLVYSYSSEDWSQGDYFTLRAKFTNISGAPSWSISTDYDDKTFEINSAKIYGDGWHEISLISDSVKVPVRVYGNFNFDVPTGTLIVDSIQLVKKALDEQKYSQKYRQKRYDLNEKFSKKEGEKTDSAEISIQVKDDIGK